MNVTRGGNAVFAGLVLLFSLMAGACTKKTPQAGNVCKIEDEGKIVCADAKTALLCQGSKLLAIPCRGPNGCEAAKGKNAEPTCDRSLGREGDACYTEHVFGVAPYNTCSDDKTSVLRCEGKFVVDLRCRGPKGCDPTKPHPSTFPDTACDRSLGEIGDPCNTRGHEWDSLGVCSVDFKRKLVCDLSDKGKLVTSRICLGGCSVGHLDGDPGIPMPVCSPGVVEAGKLCGKDDPAECSSDGTALLVCDPATGGYVAKPCAKKKRCIHEKGMLAYCPEA